MPSSAAEIVRILDLQDDAVDHYAGGHPDESLLAKVYGGQLIAQALVAATRTVPAGRPVHSLQTVCLDPGRHGEPVHFEVERIRDGRSFSARAVKAFQGGRPVLRLLASYQPREPGLSHETPMPVAPPPQGLPFVHEIMAEHSNLSGKEWRVEWRGLDIRYVPGPLEGRIGRTPAVQQLWVRVKDRLPDDPHLHRHIVAYLSDLAMASAALLPHGLVFGDLDLPRATLNHSVWFHEDARADEWLFVDQRSPWAGGARGLSFASVYRLDGRPVASLAQEGLIRPLGEMRQRLGFD